MPPEPVPIIISRRILSGLAIGLAASAVIAAAISIAGYFLDVATSDDKGPVYDDATSVSRPPPPRRDSPSDTADPDYEAIRINAEAMDEIEPEVLPPKQEVAALESPRPLAEELIQQTVERAGDILTEEHRLSENADEARLVQWMDDCFRHADPQLDDCVMMTFVEGGGILEESLSYCYSRYPVQILSDEDVATLDQEDQETAVALAEP